MIDWFKEKLLGLFAPKYIGAIVRAVIQSLSGLLLKVGIDQAAVNGLANALEPILTALAGIGLSLLWSLIQKKKNSD
jgi:hypothetical protein